MAKTRGQEIFEASDKRMQERDKNVRECLKGYIDFLEPTEAFYLYGIVKRLVEKGVDANAKKAV